MFLRAGGGGKSKERKDRILAKNQKLKEQRSRRAKTEKEGKAEKTKSKEAAEEVQNGVHPSRRGRVPNRR